jgi:hypothetical protein
MITPEVPADRDAASIADQQNVLVKICNPFERALHFDLYPTGHFQGAKQRKPSPALDSRIAGNTPHRVGFLQTVQPFQQLAARLKRIRVLMGNEDVSSPSFAHEYPHGLECVVDVLLRVIANQKLAVT